MSLLPGLVSYLTQEDVVARREGDGVPSEVLAAPLLSKDAEERRREAQHEAEEPEDVDEDSIPRPLEGWRGEVWHGRIDEVPVDSETRDLSRKVDEDLVC